MQRFVAESVHWCLYALADRAGARSAGSRPRPIRRRCRCSDCSRLPSIWSENRALSDQLFVMHRYIGIALAVLMVGHIGAALQHHFIRQDRVLMRMISGG